jgi:hypothetical protein
MRDAEAELWALLDSVDDEISNEQSRSLAIKARILALLIKRQPGESVTPLRVLEGLSDE